MKGNGILAYRLLLAVDIQGYSRRDTREQLLAQQDLSDALDHAARGAGLDRARWDKQVGGDGELATLPEGVDPAPVAGDFAIGLAQALRDLNRGGDRPRLRVRLAAHHGTLTAGPFGPAGDAPIVVQRLLDAAPLRRLLTGDAGGDLAYVVSDSLFEDVVQTGFCTLPPAAFQAMKIVAKGTTFRGHILVGPAERDRSPRRGAAAGQDEPMGRDGQGDRPQARVFDFPPLPVPQHA